MVVGTVNDLGGVLMISVILHPAVTNTMGESSLESFSLYISLHRPFSRLILHFPHGTYGCRSYTRIGRLFLVIMRTRGCIRVARQRPKYSLLFYCLMPGLPYDYKSETIMRLVFHKKQEAFAI